MRRVRTLVLIVPLLAACGRPDTTAGSSGRLRIEREGNVLLDAPATASRCAADTTVAITAVTTRAVGAVALRVNWPSDSATALTIVSPPAATGAASVGFRTLGDSAPPALVGVRGTLRLAAGATIDGTFDAVAPTQQGAPDSIHLTGRLTGVPVADDLCPGTTTP